MRVLYAGRSLAEPVGGGELSARALVWAIGRSHDVRVVGAATTTAASALGPGCEVFDHAVAPASGLPRQFGLNASERAFRRVIAEHVERFAPQLVILQQPSWLDPGDLPAATALILFVRSPLCFAAWNPSPVSWRRVGASPFAAFRFRTFRPLLERADLIVTNSCYMRDELLRRRGVRSVAVPPLIVHERSEAAPDAASGADRITFIGLDRWKGADMAIALARALPRRRFLFLAGNRASAPLRDAAARLVNVELREWTPDIHAELRKARVLLMPSCWAEPFGRVAVEAATHGVPTVATAIGGLPEAIGDGGILLPPGSDLGRWRDAIERLDDSDHYRRLSAAARAHARQFDLHTTLARLQEAFLEHGGVDLPLRGGSAAELAAWSARLEATRRDSTYTAVGSP